MGSSGDSNSSKPFAVDELDLRVTREDSRAQEELAHRYRAVSPEHAAAFFASSPATYEQLKARRGPRGPRFTL